MFSNRRRPRLGGKLTLAAMLATLALVVDRPSTLARVNPLSVIERQIQRPNMLILLDTSASMIFLPGEKEAEMNEAGPDCDNGDSYCRTVGTQNRCFFSNGGKKGAGVIMDKTTCTTNSDCTSKGYCRFNEPWGCQSSTDCANYGWGGACTGNICTNSLAEDIECNTDADCPVGVSCTRYANDFCVTNSTTAAPVRMCKQTLKKCLNDSHCNGGPGDTCGPASSRMVIAKRALNAVVQDFSTSVNFGFMTFTQSGYYPYFPISPASISNVTRTAYLDQATLESADTPCFTAGAGPSASCTINNVVYTRVSANNSRYRVNRGTYFENIDASWTATCQTECAISGQGLGLYQGSYYTYTFPDGTPDYSSEWTAPDYKGRKRTDRGDGKTYLYYESPASVRNDGNIYLQREDDPKIPIPSASGAACSTTKGATWNSTMVPFMDTAKDITATSSKNMARKLAQALEKASSGGVIADSGTPSGCALKNGGAGVDHRHSVYHYIQKVKNDNGANGVSCRPNFVLFLTDGIPSGNDNDSGTENNNCSDPACATSPPGDACPCQAVKAARSIYSSLGTKVYVVGFSGALSNDYAKASLNNIAKAGGTSQAFFAVAETDLYNALASAIYEAIKGSYATSPIAVGADDSDPKTPTTIVLDSRADFPSWKGHLIAYDASTSPPTLLWDAATAFDPSVDPDFWKKRNVWTSDGYNMVKIDVNPSTGAINNATQLKNLGLGVTDAEAALVARWLLGDPSLKNPAVFGAVVNSTPTQLGKSPNPSLTYAGSSDGMLHAFHSRTQTVGGTTYYAGREAFAYVPQDMLKTIRKLYAQGGQRPDPRDHIFGMANSAKVKKICSSYCNSPGQEVYKTVLIMPEGFGGRDVFALDVGSPFGASGIKTTAADPPIKLLWNTETAVGSGQKDIYDAAMGQTISLPGFYYGKSSAKDDYRSIFASGYTEQTSSAAGLKIINASTATGNNVSTHSVMGLGSGCSKPKVDPTEPTMLADVSVARRFGSEDFERIAAAYVGDTWGNLFRYVPTTDSEGNILGSAGTVTALDSFSCRHPLHYATTVVQLDRHDATKNPGQLYLAQVTNSPMDLRTDEWSTDFPPSQIILRRDLATAGSAVNPDLTWGDAQGRIVLNANNPAQICAVWDSSGSSCTTPMPTNARPIGSPTGILRDDFNGFGLVTLWYVPDMSGCTKGQTYLTIHEIDTNESVQQIHGEKIGDEPVVGAVFAAGKLMVVLASGPKTIAASKLGNVKVEYNRAGATTSLVDRYRRIGWMEIP